MEILKKNKTMAPEAEAASETKHIKWSTVVSTLLLSMAIVVCILVIGQVLSKGYVSLAGNSLFRVVTGSMEPEIPVGSILIAREVPIEQIQTGDIVTYRSRESGMFDVIITHRVISVYEGSGGKRYLETKGDANPYADANYVDEAHLVGKVIFYTKQENVFAEILSFVTSGVGFLACIVLPCFLIGMLVMRDCIKSMRAELDAIHGQIQEENKADPVSPDCKREEEDYEALCQRLRNELLEELKQGAEPENK